MQTTKKSRSRRIDPVDTMKDLLQRLAAVPGPSGHEQEISRLIQAELQSSSEHITTDTLGNLIVHRPASRPLKKATGGLRIMISTPMDEPGIMVTHIEGNGFVRLAPIGPVDPQYLPGRQISFLNGVEGIVGCVRTAGNNALPGMHQMFIDVGASNPTDCPVEVGDVAVFKRAFIDMGAFLSGSALASRAALLVSLETMRSLRANYNDLYFVFTTQQHFGSRGSRVSAYGIEPEAAISIGVAQAADLPGAPNHGLKLGKGPAIKIRDESTLADPRVVSWMVWTAEKKKIPFQREVQAAGNSDAVKIQGSRTGVMAGALSMPARYLGSPTEMISMEDFANTTRLLAEMLGSPVQLRQ